MPILMRFLIDFAKRLKHPNLRLIDAFRWSVLHDWLGRTLTLRPNNLSVPLTLRGGSFDRSILKQLIIDEEYNITAPGPVRTIIDAGANVGFGTLYFAEKFPDATIVALEPELGNFNALVAACAHSSRLIPVRGGLWSKECHLRIGNPKGVSIGFKVEELEKESEESLPAYTVDGLMRKFSFEKIDILKIDIEGAEREIFRNDVSAWIDKVGILIIELHDFLMPGTAEAFFTHIHRMKPYHFEVKGENLVFTKLN